MGQSKNKRHKCSNSIGAFTPPYRDICPGHALDSAGTVNLITRISGNLPAIKTNVDIDGVREGTFQCKEYLTCLPSLPDLPSSTSVGDTHRCKEYLTSLPDLPGLPGLPSRASE